MLMRPAPGGDAFPENRDRDQRTVLVIEDHAVVRALIVDLLEQHEYTVVAAGDGERAIQFAGSLERVDAVLADLHLPGVDGVAAAQAIQAFHPQARVLYMTGDETGIHARRDLPQHDRRQVLGKPFSSPDLLQRLHEILEPI
jgi:CheY-like chemotaxis protein